MTSGWPIADTGAEVMEMLVGRWRSMTPAERFGLARQLCLDAERLAVAGIRSRDPGISSEDLSHELTRRRYGCPLADAARAGR